MKTIKVISIPWFVTPEKEVTYLGNTKNQKGHSLILKPGISYLAFKARIDNRNNPSIIIMDNKGYCPFTTSSCFSEFKFESKCNRETMEIIFNMFNKNNKNAKIIWK